MAQPLLNLKLLRQRILERYGTQSAFAQHQGWSKQYLSRVLTGKANLSLARTAELAEALGVTLVELVSESATYQPAPANALHMRETAVQYVARPSFSEESMPSQKNPSAPTGLALKMTPELDAIIREHPEMEPLREIIADGRPWSELNQEERRERAEKSRGILRWSPATVDDFLARKHAETEAEERKYAARS